MTSFAKQYRESERLWWTRLKNLCDNGDTAKFFAEYARYLKAKGIHSERRLILYEMAVKASQSNGKQADG